LHLVDASDAAWRDQHQVTRTVLEEIGAGANPTFLVLNKADRLSPEQIAELASEFPEALIMSARNKADVERLYARIVDFFEKDMQEQEFLIPYDQQRNVAVLHEQCRVLEERYDESGALIRVRAPSAVLGRLRRDLLGEISPS
jgi:GTPase